MGYNLTNYFHVNKNQLFKQKFFSITWFDTNTNDSELWIRESWILKTGIDLEWSFVNLRINFIFVRYPVKIDYFTIIYECCSFPNLNGRFSVWVVFNNFLLIDATDRSKISSDPFQPIFRRKPIPPFIFHEHSFKRQEIFLS